MLATLHHDALGSHWPRWHGRRLVALCTVLGLLALAASGSHRVHHLIDLWSHSHHHTHDDQTQPIDSIDCLFFFLMQYSPIGEASSAPLSALLTSGEHATCELTRYFPQVLVYAFQARSPPALHLFNTVLG